VIVTLPHAQPVFAIEHHVGNDWAFVFALALVPVTVIELAKWSSGFRPAARVERSIDRPAVRP